MSSLKSAFEIGKKDNRALLIGYISAGYPTLEKSIEMAKAMIAGGVDVIEVGLPYSDPVMDGPIIQRSSEESLRNGTRTSDVFQVVKSLSTSVPTLVMTYWNPVEKYQVAKFSEELKSAGGVGLITPDLTVEESEKWVQKSTELDLARVYVLAPSSSELRITKVTEKSSGFVYAASLMGVTGTRNQVSSSAQGLVERIRHQTGLSGHDLLRHTALHAGQQSRRGSLRWLHDQRHVHAANVTLNVTFTLRTPMAAKA